jgi:hypothetical protein
VGVFVVNGVGVGVVVCVGVGVFELEGLGVGVVLGDEVTVGVGIWFEEVFLVVFDGLGLGEGVVEGV